MRNAWVRRIHISERAEATAIPSESSSVGETPASDDTLSRWQRVGSYVSFAAVCAYAAVQFHAADPRPWGLAAGWATTVAVALGPIAWLARDRLPSDRPETLTHVALAGAIPALSLGLGAPLVFGATPILVVERAVVPERLRETAA